MHERVLVVVFFLRLFLGAADIATQARHDLQVVGIAAELVLRRAFTSLKYFWQDSIVRLALKITSAKRAATSMPSSEVPACTITGRPWVDVATFSGPRTLKCSPL